MLLCQVMFPLVDGTICVNEAKARHVDGAIAADFKGCCNDSALVGSHSSFVCSGCIDIILSSLFTDS